MTVLMYANKAGLEGLCYKLIELGADINAKDDDVPPLSRVLLSSAMHISLTGCVGVFFQPDLQFLQYVSDPSSLARVAQLREAH